MDKANSKKYANIFLGINGIPLNQRPKNGSVHLSYNATGFWVLSNQTTQYNLEINFLKLYNLIAKKIWGDGWKFDQAEASINSNLADVFRDTGLNPESNLSKDDFNKMLGRITDKDDKVFFNRYLYTIDCFSLVSNIQEINKEIIYLIGDFYYILNFESESDLPSDKKVGFRTAISPSSSKLNGLMSLIFIRLHSLLDYFAKLAYEIENIQVDFERYPKFSSKNILYRDAKKLKVWNSKGTLFDDDSIIKEIESYRNELIHNSLLDDTPRIYEKYKDLKLIERYLLLPDTNDEGRLESYINRRFFYSNERKFNYILPDLLNNFLQRQICTMLLLLK